MAHRRPWDLNGWLHIVCDRVNPKYSGPLMVPREDGTIWGMLERLFQVVPFCSFSRSKDCIKAFLSLVGEQA